MNIAVLVLCYFSSSVAFLYCGVIELVRNIGIKLSPFRHAAINWNKYFTILFSILCPSLTVKTVNTGWDLWSHLSEHTVGKHVGHIMHYEELSEKSFWINADTAVITKMKVKSSKLYWKTFSSLSLVNCSKICCFTYRLPKVSKVS